MPPTKHAALGASGAYRWMECPGSIRLAEQAPEPKTSKYALEGSAAHELAEQCLNSGDDAAVAVGIQMPVERDGEYEYVEVTDDMADAVQVYLDFVREKLANAGDVQVEVRFSLEDLDPPAPMFGTADAVAWNPETRVLDVADYKHGRGVVVEAEDNPQLLYYALGAVLALRVKPEIICVTIVQPRANHPDGPIRSCVYGWDELVAFKEELMAAARATVELDAPVGPVGDHCRFCPAQAICPAQQENALAVVQEEFGSIAEQAETLPAPTELTEDQILRALEAASTVEDWFNAIRSYVKTRLEQGEEVPGWKLVPKRAYRRWADEEEVEGWLRARFRVGDIYKKKLVSPYQAEKLLKDRPRTEIPEGFITSKSSGTNLVPESNPRPAVTPALVAAEAFAAEED